MTQRIPARMRELLDGSGLPWRIESGGKHQKIIVGERLCAIFPRSGQVSVGRSLENSLAQIRRKIRELGR
jgi:hypothetical protein